jgi:hypothetical protein
MTTEEQKAKNREKFKRYCSRHWQEVKQQAIARYRKKKLNTPPKARSLINEGAEPFRTFELCDPRDPEQLPHVIGVCPAGTTPVWLLMWACRHYSNTRWAKWFRRLDDLGLEPVERRGWAVGRFAHLTHDLASKLVDTRAKEICKLVGKRPKWLYAAGCQRAQPVGCLCPDGRVQRYRNVRQAWRASGVSYRRFDKYLNTSMPTPDGLIWFGA